MKLVVGENLLIGWMMAADAALRRKCWTWTIVMPQLSEKPHFRLMTLATIRYGFEESTVCDCDPRQWQYSNRGGNEDLINGAVYSATYCGFMSIFALPNGECMAAYLLPHF